MTQTTTWKEVLQPQMPEKLAHDIDIFEGQIELKKQGKLDEKSLPKPYSPRHLWPTL